MGCVIGRIHYGLKVVFRFKHFTAYHYHHNSRVLTGVEMCNCLWSLSCGGVSNMLPVLSITFHCHYYIWGALYSTDTFQFRWLKGSCYYHHQIGSINLTHYHIFPWLCASDVYHIIFCHLLHIHPRKPCFFQNYCTVYDECKYSFWLADRVHLFVHCTISLSSLRTLIWRY